MKKDIYKIENKINHKINNGDLKVEGYDSYPIRQLQTQKNSS